MLKTKAFGIGLIVLGVACRGDEDAATERVVFDNVRDTTVYVDSATGVRLISPEARPQEFTVVELPAGFPEFPRPPDALVVEARVDPIAGGGTYSTTTIVVERETTGVFEWYRQALRDAGWVVSDESQLGQVHKLKARREDVMLDLVVQVHPEYPGSGWTRIVAFVTQRA